MEYYAAERKNKHLSFETAWMELESIMVSEISQVVEDKPNQQNKKTKHNQRQ